MGTLNAWLNYLTNYCYEVGAVYIPGGQGQEVNETYIKKKITNAENQKKCINHYNEEIKKGKKPVYAFDCSGLGMYFFYNLKDIIPADRTAEGMRVLCQEIPREEVSAGDWVFTFNGKRATHVGFATSNKFCIECRNYDTGVYCSEIDKRDFNYYARPDCLKNEIAKYKELQKLLDDCDELRNYLANEIMLL